MHNNASHYMKNGKYKLVISLVAVYKILYCHVKRQLTEQIALEHKHNTVPVRNILL